MSKSMPIYLLGIAIIFLCISNFFLGHRVSNLEEKMNDQCSIKDVQ